MCKMNRVLIALALTLSLGACKKSEESAQPAADNAPQGLTEEERQAVQQERTEQMRQERQQGLQSRTAALQQSREAAERLGRTVKNRLMRALNAGGPAEAARVCAEEAQAMARSITESTGVEVGRSSLRLRNPDNAPRPWVDAWLQEQGERAARGTPGYASVDEGNARVILPIGIEPMCMTCHGPREQIPAEVAQILAANYPEDRAFGYAIGDLRGALWAEKKVAADQ